MTVRARNRKGEEVEYTGTGLLARAFCHEIDHLDGVLFVDHVKEMLEPERPRRRRVFDRLERRGGGQA